MQNGKPGNMWDQLLEVYNGKKIFITGHTGFKGSWLLKVLSLVGAEIKGYALEPYTKDDLYYLINGDTLCTSVIADLRNKEKLYKEVCSFNPDFIFHLAAQPLVRVSYEAPAETFEVNAIGTAYLLDAVRMLQKPCSVLLITTDKVYHNYETPDPYKETDRLGGYDPYSASKACSELVIDSYRNSFFNSKDYKKHQKGIAVARAGNVIGGGDWAKDRLLPDIARALGKAKIVAIRNPKSVRPWQHVLEPVLGYLKLGECLFQNPTRFSDAYNFGPYISDALTVEEMVGLAIKTWGKGSFEIIQSNSEPHEAGLLKLDITKAKDQLDWHPKFNAAKAVQYTVDWYQHFFSNKNTIADFTEKQIRQFIDG